jgi:hypothetical protein
MKRRKKRLEKYKKCHRSGKISYPTEDKALLGLGALWRNRGVDLNDMGVYECYFCGKWHMGHKSKYKKYLKEHGIE